MAITSHRISITSAYSTIPIRDKIFAGTSAWYTNHYDSYSYGYTPTAFDNSVSWFYGNVSTSPYSEKYYISSILSFIGSYANTTADQFISMIDRSIAADRTRPSGTFYFMNTTDIRSTVVSNTYAIVSNGIANAGGNAQIINGWLPSGHQDALGVMSGFAIYNISGANMTLMPGSYADHVTSCAATLLGGCGQTLMTEWIKKGASGTSGAIEEPCGWTDVQGSSQNLDSITFTLMVFRWAKRSTGARCGPVPDSVHGRPAHETVRICPDCQCERADLPSFRECFH